jgi:hypothetical protein
VPRSNAQEIERLNGDTMKTKKIEVKEPVVHNHTGLTRGAIESQELIGIHVNNWQQRTVKLYKDWLEDSVLTIGTFHNGETVVISREKLSECMNFRIAIDYWKHGQKIYTRD